MSAFAFSLAATDGKARTGAISTPRAAMAAIRSGVKWRPAVGAATAPGSAAWSVW